MERWVVLVALWHQEQFYDDDLTDSSRSVWLGSWGYSVQFRLKLKHTWPQSSYVKPLWRWMSWIELVCQTAQLRSVSRLTAQRIISLFGDCDTKAAREHSLIVFIVFDVRIIENRRTSRSLAIQLHHFEFRVDLFALDCLYFRLWITLESSAEVSRTSFTI